MVTGRLAGQDYFINNLRKMVDSQDGKYVRSTAMMVSTDGRQPGRLVRTVDSQDSNCVRTVIPLNSLGMQLTSQCLLQPHVVETYIHLIVELHSLFLLQV